MAFPARPYTALTPEDIERLRAEMFSGGVIPPPVPGSVVSMGPARELDPLARHNITAGASAVPPVAAPEAAPTGITESTAGSPARTGLVNPELLRALLGIGAAMGGPDSVAANFAAAGNQLITGRQERAYLSRLMGGESVSGLENDPDFRAFDPAARERSLATFRAGQEQALQEKTLQENTRVADERTALEGERVGIEQDRNAIRREEIHQQAQQFAQTFDLDERRLAVLMEQFELSQALEMALAERRSSDLRAQIAGQLRQAEISAAAHLAGIREQVAAAGNPRDQRDLRFAELMGEQLTAERRELQSLEDRLRAYEPGDRQYEALLPQVQDKQRSISDLSRRYTETINTLESRYITNTSGGNGSGGGGGGGGDDTRQNYTSPDQLRDLPLGTRIRYNGRNAYIQARNGRKILIYE